MNHKVFAAVNIFIVDGNKVLLNRRANTGWRDGWLCAPGGHVIAGETPRKAMVREIKEELGVDIAINDMDFVCVAARVGGNGKEYASYEFKMQKGDYEFVNAEPHKCSELAWVDIHNLPEDIIPDFRVVIEQSILGSTNYLEIGYGNRAGFAGDDA